MIPPNIYVTSLSSKLDREYICSRKGLGCPSGYDAGLTNQTSLVRFSSPLNFS